MLMAEAEKAPTDRQAKMLQIIGRCQRGVRPAQFGYLLEDEGLVVNRSGRDWHAQGAGRIGGRELAFLERNGWIHGGGDHGRDYVLTDAGMRAIAK